MSRFNPAAANSEALQPPPRRRESLLKRGARGAAVTIIAMGIFSAGQLMRGGEPLPVATGRPAPPKLPADVAASRTAFETATFGMG